MKVIIALVLSQLVFVSSLNLVWRNNKLVGNSLSKPLLLSDDENSESNRVDLFHENEQAEDSTSVASAFEKGVRLSDKSIKSMYESLFKSETLLDILAGDDENDGDDGDGDSDTPSSAPLSINSNSSSNSTNSKPKPKPQPNLVTLKPVLLPISNILNTNNNPVVPSAAIEVKMSPKKCQTVVPFW